MEPLHGHILLSTDCRLRKILQERMNVRRQANFNHRASVQTHLNRE